MKNNEVISAWNKVNPGEEDEYRMLEHILENREASRPSKVILKRSTFFAVAAACLLLCLTVFGLLNKGGNSASIGNKVIGNTETAGGNAYTAKGDEAAVAEQTDMAAVTEDEKTGAAFKGFVLTAYTSETEGAYLSNDYQKDMTASILKPEVKVLLAGFSPLMSSVPGLPFTFSLNSEVGDTVSDINLKITADNGELLNWDTRTGIVTSKGSEVSCRSGETLYWSPLSAEGSQNQGEVPEGAQITVAAIKDGKELGHQIIYITESGGNYYAQIGELLQI